MPRGANRPSKVFHRVLKNANAALVLAADKSAAFKHRGVMGDARALALHRFFADHLPANFGIATGEAIDHGDRRSGQLDLVIYDRATASPIEASGRDLLLPCEAIYAVIEVKSVLNQSEIKKAAFAAKQLRALRPFKKEFISARGGGQAADDKAPRFLFVLFAFKSNAGAKDWLKKEYARLEVACAAKGISLDVIDRLFVLNRGMINPGQACGKIQMEEDVIFLELYLHVVNFLRREAKRRPPMDWQAYTSKTSPGWTKIKKD